MPRRNSSHPDSISSRSNDAYVMSDVARTLRYAVNGLNQYTAVGTSSYGYDANGNLTSDGATSYTYDVENRLVSASGAKNATLRYDPLGRLYETVGGGVTTRFLYDGDELVAEYNAAGTLLRRYIHGAGSDDPLFWYEGAARRQLYSDHQGSIVSVADASGSPVQINRYDEWGVPQAGNLGRFQYTGQAWIPELGIYYYKARIYSPIIGRFMQTDPIGYDDQMLLYAYVGNDPVNKTDPSGMSWWSMAGKLILKGGDIAATTAGVVEDANTVTDNTQPVLTRAGAAASILSEAAPVSARDVKGAFGVVKRFFTRKPKCCFVAGTLVDTDQDLVPIESIKAGDLVWSRDANSGVTILKPVFVSLENALTSSAHFLIL